MRQISVRLGEDKNPYFGDSPNGLGINSDGKIFYVANGMDNALAVVNLRETILGISNENISTVSGFIPTGAYPGAVAVYQ